MSNKNKGGRFDDQGRPIYRFQTRFGSTVVHTAEGDKCVGNPLVIYFPTSDPEYAELLRKGKEGKLGELSGGQGKKTGECFHTQEMLDRSAMAVADHDGSIETPSRDVALYIAANVDGAVYDKHCDQSLLDELEVVAPRVKKSASERARDITLARNSVKEAVEANNAKQAPASK